MPSVAGGKLHNCGLPNKSSQVLNWVDIKMQTRYPNLSITMCVKEAKAPTPPEPRKKNRNRNSKQKNVTRVVAFLLSVFCFFFTFSLSSASSDAEGSATKHTPFITIKESNNIHESKASIINGQVNDATPNKL